MFGFVSSEITIEIFKEISTFSMVHFPYITGGSAEEFRVVTFHQVICQCVTHILFDNQIDMVQPCGQMAQDHVEVICNHAGKSPLILDSKPVCC